MAIKNILPGFFDTNRLQGSFNVSASAFPINVEEAVQNRAEQIPAKCFGQPEELGEVCAFLCREQAGYITAQNLPLDGGVFESSF